MPVMFNEPLSFLQRLAEYMEHTYLLQQANTSTDSVERMKVQPPSPSYTHTDCYSHLSRSRMDIDGSRAGSAHLINAAC